MGSRTAPFPVDGYRQHPIRFFHRSPCVGAKYPAEVVSQLSESAARGLQFGYPVTARNRSQLGSAVLWPEFIAAIEAPSVYDFITFVAFRASHNFLSVLGLAGSGA